jgi:hypothetical protein
MTFHTHAQNMRGVVTGLKNILINGDFRVNQRGFDGNWGALSNGDFGWDRWLKNGVYIEQRIEWLNVRVGDVLTLSWQGGGNGQIVDQVGDSGTAEPSPITWIPSDVSPYMSVLVPPASTDVQLEHGEIATQFEMRSYGYELTLCHHYFYISPAKILNAFGYTYGNEPDRCLTAFLPITMRTNPDIIVLSEGPNSGFPETGATLDFSSAAWVRFKHTATPGSHSWSTYRISFSAEAEL